MKTYKMVDLHLYQHSTQLIIVALQLERDRLEKTGAPKKFVMQANQLIVYVRKQLKEAETPTEVDKLIRSIAE